jgi:amino acid transporter
MFGNNKKFTHNNVSSLGALSLVVGMIVGSGIFIKPGEVLSNAGSPIASIFAWIVGGIITLASALSVAEISVAAQTIAFATSASFFLPLDSTRRYFLHFHRMLLLILITQGYMMTAARVPQAMGERKALPFSDFLAKLHPIYPIIPLIGIVGGLYIIISTIYTSTVLSLTGIVITLLGLPVYYFLKRNNSN